jgi:hypothetical protein
LTNQHFVRMFCSLVCSIPDRSKTFFSIPRAAYGTHTASCPVGVLGALTPPPGLKPPGRVVDHFLHIIKNKSKLRGLSPRANYTDPETVACRQSQCQLLWIEGLSRSQCGVFPTAVISIF